MPVAHADVETFVNDGRAEALSAPEVVEYVLDRFHPRLTLACSFQ